MLLDSERLGRPGAHRLQLGQAAAMIDTNVMSGLPNAGYRIYTPRSAS